jgi:ubiquinone/menaquinone biosynthesis C-methylase UbiE
MENNLINVRDLLRYRTVEELIEAAERHYKEFANGEYLLAKPLVSIEEAPEHLIYSATLIQGLQLLTGMTVLDFGSGGCYLSRMLNQLGCAVISLDVSPTALEFGKKLTEIHPIIGSQPEHRFLLFDGRKIDLPDECVDRIVCMDSFHHIPNQQEILGEMSRVLKNGGIAGFCEPGPTHSLTPEAQYQMKVNRLIENDIVVEEIFEYAKLAGFTDLQLAIFPPKPCFIALDHFNAAISSGMLPQDFTNLVIHEMIHHRTFYLYKGKTTIDASDSSIKTGLLADIRINCKSIILKEMEKIEFEATIANISDKIWLPSGSKRGCVNLGVHLMNRETMVNERDYRQAISQNKVFPGETLALTFEIAAPLAGHYTMVFDLVSEYVTWFEWVGSKTVTLDLDVNK